MSTGIMFGFVSKDPYYSLLNLKVTLLICELPQNIIPCDIIEWK
jgi:hypothetical protein